MVLLRAVIGFCNTLARLGTIHGYSLLVLILKLVRRIDRRNLPSSNICLLNLVRKKAALQQFVWLGCVTQSRYLLTYLILDFLLESNKKANFKYPKFLLINIAWIQGLSYASSLLFERIIRLG